MISAIVLVTTILALNALTVFLLIQSRNRNRDQ